LEEGGAGEEVELLMPALLPPEMEDLEGLMPAIMACEEDLCDPEAPFNLFLLFLICSALCEYMFRG